MSLKIRRKSFTMILPGILSTDLEGKSLDEGLAAIAKVYKESIRSTTRKYYPMSSDAEIRIRSVSGYRGTVEIGIYTDPTPAERKRKETQLAKKKAAEMKKLKELADRLGVKVVTGEVQ